MRERERERFIASAFVSLSPELCTKALLGMFSQPCLSPRQPEAAMSTRPQCITPRTCYWDQCPTPAPLKSSTVKSNRESHFVVKAWLSPWAAGLGERLSEIPAAPVKLVTLRLCEKLIWSCGMLCYFCCLLIAE